MKNYVVNDGIKVLPCSHKVRTLEVNEIFVFGSNLIGHHKKGAAHDAWRKFGAIYGRAEGLQGKSYGIPTKGRQMHIILSIGEIKTKVERFIKYANEHSELVFLVTEIGCGRSKYAPEDIAPLFEKCLYMENVVLPERFVAVLRK